MSYTIYTLTDTRDGEIRYVGATELPLSMRLQYHVNDANSPDKQSPRVRWLRGLMKEGLKPTIEKVDSVENTSSDEAGKREDKWIEFYEEQGCDLLNVRGGGAGLYPRDGLSQWALKRLGIVPDAEVAEHEGKHVQTIFYWRKKLGIPSCRDQARLVGLVWPDTEIIGMWRNIQKAKLSFDDMGILSPCHYNMWIRRLHEKADSINGHDLGYKVIVLSFNDLAAKLEAERDEKFPEVT